MTWKQVVDNPFQNIVLIREHSWLSTVLKLT